MYTPTKQELEEMGFKIFKYNKNIIAEYCKNEGIIDIEYNSFSNTWNKGIESDDLNLYKFYPQSREDVETLIRLFKQP